MRIRSAFTMIELVFVIVVMGILGKFGTEFLFQAYKSFIFTSENNNLQANSESAVEFVASRLQYRIKDSVIVREYTNPYDSTDYDALSDANDSKDYTVLEWVSSDMDGFRSTTIPNWSGILDLNNTRADKDHLISPETNTTRIKDLIKILSSNNSDINDSALYFIGSNSDIDGYGWDGNAITDQSKVMHPIDAGTTVDIFTPRVSDFSGIDVYEYFKFAWTANAIQVEDNNTTTHTFKLEYYYDYQPWNGETFKDGKHFTIMKDISTFRATAVGSIMKIQICAKSVLQEEYSLCKEKTVF